MSRAADMKNVLVCNGVVSCGEFTAKDMLRHGPRGAYTTARTVDHWKVFGFDMHCRRLVNSLAIMGGGSMPKEWENVDELMKLVRESMRAAIEESGGESEVRLTALVSCRSLWGSHGGEEGFEVDGDRVVCCHAAPLPPVPTLPVVVEVGGSKRSHALAKDSQWVVDRAPLEKAKAVETDEVLLLDERFGILEGTQTNFFAIGRDGQVITANEDILLGTMRAKVLEAASDKIDLTPPNLASCLQWSGALLSSTSRLALPIKEIRVPTSLLEKCPDLPTQNILDCEGGGQWISHETYYSRIFEPPVSPTALKIVEKVRQSVLEDAEDLRT